MDAGIPPSLQGSIHHFYILTPLATPPMQTGGSTMMAGGLSSLMGGGALSSLAGAPPMAPPLSGAPPLSTFSGLSHPDAPTLGHGPAGAAEYGLSLALRRKPSLSKEEKQELQQLARAIGGSDDINGDGRIGCNEKDRAEQIRQDFAKRQANERALSIGTRALGFTPGDLR